MGAPCSSDAARLGLRFTEELHMTTNPAPHALADAHAML
jgi:hypothetical protein